MRVGIRWAQRVGLAFLFGSGLVWDAAAQIQYARGQNLVPVFEGWQRSADGSFNLWFGYLNRNHEEALNIPVGPDNFIEPAGPDRGQPAFFYPRRGLYAFKVSVPADWPKDRDVVWTVTAQEKVERAYGSLKPVWEIDDGVIISNFGGGGNVFVTGDPNVGPTITQAPKAQTIAAGGALSLALSATDDGWPKSRNLNKRESVGLKVSWAQYRGPGRVTFPSGRVTRLVNGQSVTKATVDAPGTYVLRAHLDDGGLFAIHDVTITVTGGSSGQP